MKYSLVALFAILAFAAITLNQTVQASEDENGDIAALPSAVDAPEQEKEKEGGHRGHKHGGKHNKHDKNKGLLGNPTGRGSFAKSKSENGDDMGKNIEKWVKEHSKDGEKFQIKPQSKNDKKE